MIYTYTGFIRGTQAVAGYTRANGTLVTLTDILTSPLVFSEFCALYDQYPQITTTVYEGDKRILEIYANVQGTSLGNIASPSSEYEGAQVLSEAFIKLIEDSATIKLAANLKVLADEDMSYLSQHCTSGETRFSNRAQKSAVDVLEMAIPTYDELCMVYGKTPTVDTSEDEDEDGEDSAQNSLATSLFVQPTTVGLVRDFSSLDCPIGTEYFKVRDYFLYGDSISYKDILQKMGMPIPLDWVEGNPDNNMLPIQSNEQDYYQGLVRLTREGIARENNLVTEAEIDNLVSKGITSQIVDYYLQDMAQEAFNLNWAHTGSASSQVEDVSDADGDSEFIPSAEVPGYYTVDFVNGKPSMVSLSARLAEKLHNHELIDGFSCIKTYTNYAVMNSYSWAQCLVQLMRWNERKPTCLAIESLSNEKQLYFDLNNLVQTSFSGVITNLTPVVLDDLGTTRKIDAMIWTGYFGETLTDSIGVGQALGIDLPSSPIIPVGFRLHTAYEGQQVYREEFIDIFTAVQQISDGTLSIHGIHFSKDTNTFSTTLDPTKDSYDVCTLGMVLSPGSSSECKSVVVQSAAVAKLGMVLAPRVKDVSIKGINTFGILSALFGTTSYADLFESVNVVGIPDEAERAQAIMNRRRVLGCSKEAIVIQSMIPQVIEPFMYLSAEIAASGAENARILGTPYLMNIAFRVMTNTESRNPMRSVQPRLQKNAKFTANVDKCQNWMEICDILPDETKKTFGFLGKYAQDVTINGKTGKRGVFFIWAPGENPAPKTCIPATSDIFVSKIVKEFLRFGNTPERDNVFVQATENSMQTIIAEITKFKKQTP